MLTSMLEKPSQGNCHRLWPSPVAEIFGVFVTGNRDITGEIQLAAAADQTREGHLKDRSFGCGAKELPRHGHRLLNRADI